MALGDPSPVAQVAAVECVACHQLHKFASNTWIILYGTWSLGQQSQRAAYVGKTFGTVSEPLIACNLNRCILRAMERAEGYY